ncbi:MAG TPA: amidophosphoribosyltransferase [Clostridiaceae bacterium]|nr:amidophosphoribosyltransferase [Clostridiaceae bacterium]
MSSEEMFMDSELHDECGVFAYFCPDETKTEAARQCYLGLFALQHRGQDSAGIVVNQNGKLFCHKEKGLVVEVFDDLTLNILKGHAAIGHVRYPSVDADNVINAQPLLIKSRKGQLAMAHNGAIINIVELRNKLEEQGAIFQTNSDAEVMLALIARNMIVANQVIDAIFMMMAEVKGAYALTIMTSDAVIGVRDPDGIRPLCIGKKDDEFFIASESCAIDAVGAEFIRDVQPGEIVIINKEGIHSDIFAPNAVNGVRPPGQLCSFEFVYFARPDSCIDGADVSEVRTECGRRLAMEHPVEADIVIGAPDSGMMAAMGYAKMMNIEYDQGLLKNRYVGRTFIQPTQMQREISVGLKFSPIKHVLRGKKICMVDDSIVRGTTMRRIVGLLKEAGATEVHLRIACPPVVYPCFYGVDTPGQDELSACHLTKEELRQEVLADSLEFLSLEGLEASLVGLRCKTCSACLNGQYPAGIPQQNRAGLNHIELASRGFPPVSEEEGIR